MGGVSRRKKKSRGEDSRGVLVERGMERHTEGDRMGRQTCGRDGHGGETDVGGRDGRGGETDTGRETDTGSGRWTRGERWTQGGQETDTG